MGKVSPLSRWLKACNSPSSTEISSGLPPSASTAFHGSVSSTCSTPSAARKATRLPSSRFAMWASFIRVLLSTGYRDPPGLNRDEPLAMFCRDVLAPAQSRARGRAPPVPADIGHREPRVGLGGDRHLAVLGRRHADRRRGPPCDRGACQRDAPPANRGDRPPHHLGAHGDPAPGRPPEGAAAGRAGA